jgi:competence protein ComEA
MKTAATPAAKPAGKVNINTADEAALTSLKGVGKTKAKAILDYRQKNGPFKSVDDLKNVKGIGDKTLAKLRDQITVE